MRNFRPWLDRFSSLFFSFTSLLLVAGLSLDVNQVVAATVSIPTASYLGNNTWITQDVIIHSDEWRTLGRPGGFLKFNESKSGPPPYLTSIEWRKYGGGEYFLVVTNASALDNPKDTASKFRSKGWNGRFIVSMDSRIAEKLSPLWEPYGYVYKFGSRDFFSPQGLRLSAYRFSDEGIRFVESIAFVMDGDVSYEAAKAKVELLNLVVAGLWLTLLTFLVWAIKRLQLVRYAFLSGGRTVLILPLIPVRYAFARLVSWWTGVKASRHSNEIRRIVEIEVVRQAVRDEASDSTNTDQLQIIKNRIAAAIAEGDDERAKFLMEFAERMKRLD